MPYRDARYGAPEVCEYNDCRSGGISYRETDLTLHSWLWYCAKCHRSFTTYCWCTDCLHGGKEYCSDIGSLAATTCQQFVYRRDRPFKRRFEQWPVKPDQGATRRRLVPRWGSTGCLLIIIGTIMAGLGLLTYIMI